MNPKDKQIIFNCSRAVACPLCAIFQNGGCFSRIRSQEPVVSGRKAVLVG